MDILEELSKKTGIPLEILKDKVKFRHIGGPGDVDGEIFAIEDIVVNGEVKFNKGEMITIIEIASTIQEEEEKSWGALLENAIDDLKKHLQLTNYTNVKYGIAIGFRYKPADVLVGRPSERIKIMMKVYMRYELGLKG